MRVPRVYSQQCSNYNPVKDSSFLRLGLVGVSSNPSLSSSHREPKYPRMENPKDTRRGEERRVCVPRGRACVNIQAEMEGREREWRERRGPFATSVFR